MAQVLKDSLRNDIINAAKKEFLEHGYKEASMRRIAANANMTVGNLYRYFKNKEDIHIQIVGETYEKINNAIKKITSNKLSFETRVYNMRLDVKSLKENLEIFANEIVDIYNEEPEEFSILFLNSDSDLYENLVNWFATILKDLIMHSYTMNPYEHKCELLSRSFSVSIFEGIKELFRINDLDNDDLKKMLKVYFRTYMYTLDTDITLFLNN